MMRKWLSLCLCVLLLLSLTACGKPTKEKPTETTTTTTKTPAEPVDEIYEQAMAKLAEGDLAEAYKLLKAATDPRGAEELEKFAFVPTTVTRKSSNGRDLVHTFTYDERGNLLSDINKGDESWNRETDNATTYTYNENGHLLTSTWRYKDETTRQVYTYDEKGNELTYSYYNADGDLQSSYTCTYDERGNLVNKESFDQIDAAYNYTEVLTYDNQDRVLTRTTTYSDGDETVRTYVYEEDGSYHYSYDSEYEGGVFTYTYWYDKEDRVVKHEAVNPVTNEVKECSETRYDEQGNEVYHRSVYYGSESVITTTYNEQGLELTSQTMHDGEVYSMTTYTYNEVGEPLTYEYFYGDSTWGRTTYTYDEQNRLLTRKAMSNNGWHQRTYTYDEDGNGIKVEQDGVDEDFVCEFTHDANGNVLAYEYTKESSDGGLYVEQNDAQWVLQYYPDGMPKEVRYTIHDANIWMDPT